MTAVGRPRIHDRAQLMQLACETISTGVITELAAKQLDVSAKSIRQWGLTPEFSEMYARARESQAWALAEQVIAIADDPTLGADQKRVMCDARKWITAKVYPKVFGDHKQVSVDVTVAGLHLQALQAGPQQAIATVVEAEDHIIEVTKDSE